MSEKSVKPVGFPDGPKVFVPEIGKEVGTFNAEPGGKVPALKHHVPLKCRGPYRPEELANYEPEKTYRTDPFGYMLCTRFTLAGERCDKRAVNRYPACTVHGGRLHPLDKLQKEIPEDQEAQELSRYQQFLAKQIDVDDLDDEELACCGFRASNGRIYRPRNVPREMATAFQKAIFDRAQRELRSHTVEAAQTVAEIMLNTTVEPDIRLKAASIMLDRNLGKAPQVVALTSDKAFEEIFSDIFTGTREESRRARIIDADVIDDPQPIAIETSNGGTVGNPDATALYSTSPNVENPSEQMDFRDRTDASGDGRDPRLFERNEAILAQSIEIKPFEYDLTDHSADITNATKKRYASRALGVNLTTPDYPLVKELTPEGLWRWRDPLGQANIQTNKKTDNSRKVYTLNDFD